MYTLILERSPESAAEKANKLVKTLLAEAVALRGSAALVVSGGQSPIPLLECLNVEPLPWEKIMVSLADERWVDSSHENSNEAMVHRHLIKNRAESTCFIPLKNDSPTPKQGARLAELALQVLPEHLDVVVLGMGMDGHTLSWFPDSPQLEALMKPGKKQRCGDAISKTAQHPRLTLTYSWISKARHIILFLASEEKTRRFQDIVVATNEPLPVVRLANDSNVNMTVIGVEKATTDNKPG